MKEIRVAIIGTGTISNQHMNRYKGIPNAKVVAACDINKPRLEAWGEKYGVTDLYTDYRELLKIDDIDSVDVCLHNNLHVPMALEVMRSGKNCYCEKPMAGSFADAKILYEASLKFNVDLAVHLDNIFFPQSRLGKQMIENGDLGHVYHARSVGFRRRLRPGLDIKPPMFGAEFINQKFAQHGALYDMGVYHISQLLFMMGLPKLERVSGRVYREVEYNGRPAEEAGMQVEDLGVGFVNFENNLTLDIIESWAIHQDEFGPAFITGSKGGLKLTMDGPSMMGGGMSPGLKYFTVQNGRDIDIDLKPGSNNMLYSMLDPNERFYTDDQVHWISYLSGDLKERFDTPRIALETMRVSEGIFLSSELKREVTADEIEALSVSTAMLEQETEWGTFKYSLEY